MIGDRDTLESSSPLLDRVSLRVGREHGVGRSVQRIGLRALGCLGGPSKAHSQAGRHD